MTTTALITERQLGVIGDALDRVCGDQRAVRTPQQRLDLVVLARGLSQRLEAITAVLVAEADAVDAAMVAKGTPLTSWLAMTDNDRKAAAAMVHTGKDLAADPQVREAATTGKASVRQARAIAKTLQGLPAELTDEQHREAARVLIDRAGTDSPELLAKAGPEVAAQVAPELAPADPVAEAEARRKRAYARRFLRFSADGDGAVAFTGSLPDLEATGFKRLIAAYRESDKRRARDLRDPLAEERTPEQRNADALVRLLAEHWRGRRAPRVAGDRPRVVVTMSYDMLREQAEQAGILDSGTEISAGDLRRLCCEANLVPVVLGGESEILDWGRSRRLVSPEQRQALSLRDGGCVFPGCDAEDAACDAHHLDPYWNWGETNLDELALVCGHHHQLVEPLRFFNAEKPPDRWEIRMGTDAIPEVIPPARVDPQRRPLRHERFGREAA